ncbi:hypothetical protein CYY_003177 [Polysphondylium violaceum]|uniref:Uncharacterized protein n=1 Tax=Polysphondylium violaceum TaxID=133409 RepID=A0A8J4Q762_9MYCE|nr:hypothetical protein CYY_003177 [Polysphondylium violaceum]
MTKTTVCPFCKQDIDNWFILSHIPQCYCQFCDRHNIMRYCLCKQCNGYMNHPTNISLVYQTTISSVPLSSTISSQTQTQTQYVPLLQTQTQQPISSPLSGTSMTTTSTTSSNREDQFRNYGKICCVCDNRLGTSSLPIVHVGETHSVFICKIQHLQSDSSASEVYSFIKNLHEKVESGQLDLPFRVFNGGLQNSQTPNNNNNDTCSGLDVLYSNANRVPCNNVLSINEKTHLYIKEKVSGVMIKTKFCNVEHLLRYLVTEYCTRKRSALSITSTNPTTTNKGRGSIRKTVTGGSGKVRKTAPRSLGKGKKSRLKDDSEYEDEDEEDGDEE